MCMITNRRKLRFFYALGNLLLIHTAVWWITCCISVYLEDLTLMIKSKSQSSHNKKTGAACIWMESTGSLLYKAWVDKSRVFHCTDNIQEGLRRYGFLLTLGVGKGRIQLLLIITIVLHSPCFKFTLNWVRTSISSQTFSSFPTHENWSTWYPSVSTVLFSPDFSACKYGR